MPTPPLLKNTPELLLRQGYMYCLYDEAVYTQGHCTSLYVYVMEMFILPNIQTSLVCRYYTALNVPSPTTSKSKDCGLFFLSQNRIKVWYVVYSYSQINYEAVLSSSKQ